MYIFSTDLDVGALGGLYSGGNIDKGNAEYNVTVSTCYEGLHFVDECSGFCGGFFGCNGATKGIAILTKKIALGIKKCFVKKEDAE